MNVFTGIAAAHALFVVARPDLWSGFAAAALAVSWLGGAAALKAAEQAARRPRREVDDGAAQQDVGAA